MNDQEVKAMDACPSELDRQKLLDETLSPIRRAQVIEHIQKCTKCQTACEKLISELDVRPNTTIHNLDNPWQVSRIVEVVRHHSTTMGPMIGIDDEQASMDSADRDQLQLEYSLIRELGRGGQGLVYLAKDLALGRNVVIKLLSTRLQSSSSSVERFKREARAVASLQSQFIVPIYRVGTLPSGRLFMVMEYVEGSTLRQLHQESKIHSFQQIALLVQQIAVGLSDAHEKRLVHRDIKPENILIQSQDSMARIVDFGLAFDVEDDARLTIDGAIAGTPAYMSPEQVLDPNSVDFSTDIYSLGVVLYELLTGEVPFRGTTRMTLFRLVNEDAVAPCEYSEKVPQDLQTICLRAMSKDRSCRFRSAAELVKELERFLVGVPIESRPIGRPEKLWRKVKKNPAVSAMVCSLVLLGMLLTTVSIMAAIHFNSLNQQIVNQAAISNQQRDAALATLGDLAIQLQQKFDDPEVFIEEIQQSSLEIALRGLEKMEGLAGQTSEGGLARAIALTRLSQTLSRLGKEAAARECIDKSDLLLSGLLNSQPHKEEVVLAFADTVLTREECCEIDDEQGWIEMLVRAIDHCNNLPVRGEETSIRLCQLLACQAESQMRQDLLDDADASVSKAIHSVSQLWSGNELPVHSRLRDVVLRSQLGQIDLHRVRGSNHRSLANKLLEQVMTVGDSEYADGPIMEARFSLLESLGLLVADDFVLPDEKWRARFSNQLDKLILWAQAGSDDYAISSEILALLASNRMDIGLEETARDLLRLRAWLAEKRLEQSNSDQFALLEKFDSLVALASIELDSAEGQHNSIKHCLAAIDTFDRLAAADSLGESEWDSIEDVLDMMVEINEDFPALRDSFCDQASSGLSKMNHWIADRDVSASVSSSQVEEIRELVDELSNFFNNG